MLKNIPMPAQKMNFTPNSECSRLISAAVINCDFRNILLVDPARAIHDGYHGEQFQFGTMENRQITSIRANTLVEFANQLSKI
jgi:hypothetical protein